MANNNKIKPRREALNYQKKSNNEFLQNYPVKSYREIQIEQLYKRFNRDTWYMMQEIYRKKQELDQIYSGSRQQIYQNGQIAANQRAKWPINYATKENYYESQQPSFEEFYTNYYPYGRKQNRQEQHFNHSYGTRETRQEQPFNHSYGTRENRQEQLFNHSYGNRGNRREQDSNYAYGYGFGQPKQEQFFNYSYGTNQYGTGQLYDDSYRVKQYRQERSDNLSYGNGQYKQNQTSNYPYQTQQYYQNNPIRGSNYSNGLYPRGRRQQNGRNENSQGILSYEAEQNHGVKSSYNKNMKRTKEEIGDYNQTRKRQEIIRKKHERQQKSYFKGARRISNKKVNKIKGKQKKELARITHMSRFIDFMVPQKIFIVKLMTEDSLFFGMIHSGIFRSFIDAKFVRDNELTKKYQKRDLEYIKFNGEKMSIAGKSKIPLMFKEKGEETKWIVPHTLHLVKNLPVKAILGYDFLEKYKCKFHLEQLPSANYDELMSKYWMNIPWNLVGSKGSMTLERTKKMETELTIISLMETRFKDMESIWFNKPREIINSRAIPTQEKEERNKNNEKVLYNTEGYTSINKINKQRRTENNIEEINSGIDYEEIEKEEEENTFNNLNESFTESSQMTENQNDYTETEETEENNFSIEEINSNIFTDEGESSDYFDTEEMCKIVDSLVKEWPEREEQKMFNEREYMINTKIIEKEDQIVSHESEILVFNGNKQKENDKKQIQEEKPRKNEEKLVKERKEVGNKNKDMKENITEDLRTPSPKEEEKMELKPLWDYDFGKEENEVSSDEENELNIQN